MSAAADPNREIIFECSMKRLDGFARGLDLGETTTRQIVEKVVADMPGQPDEERLVEARMCMIIASA